MQKYNDNRIKQKTMRQFFCFLILLAAVVTAGCIFGDDKPTPPAPTVVTSPIPTVMPTPTPAPVEMAYLEKMDCSVVEEKVTTYRCIGKVRLPAGGPREVTVMVKYPDTNSFDSGVITMGGSDPVLRPFILFPDLRYKDQEPRFFVRIGRTEYPVVMQNGTAIAYENPPPAPAVTATVFVQNRMVSVPDPTKKTTVTTPQTPLSVRTTSTPQTTAAPFWVPTVSAINPATGYPDNYRGFIVEGWDFRQDPPPKVYLRRQGSSCEFCGVQATDVRVTTPTTLQCLFDLSGEASGPASYDVLVTNSNLQDSYGILKNGLTILEHTPVPTQETLVTP